MKKARDKAQEAWDNRDTSLDGGEVENNDTLETAKNDAIAAFNNEAIQTAVDEALSAYNLEEAKIDGMRDTFAANQKEKEDDRKDAELLKAEEYIYGKDAEGD